MRPDAILLFPGAGGDSSHHTLVALGDGLAPTPVYRRDFPYRIEGRKAPDRAPKLVATVIEHAETLRAGGLADMVLGGRSMGGRMCSMAVAQGLEVLGLVLLSYPLHPPGKPERLRVEHFPDIDVPCLFISGTRDPFGTPDEFTQATKAIAGPVTIEWLDGQRHDPKGCDEQITVLTRTWLEAL